MVAPTPKPVKLPVSRVTRDHRIIIDGVEYPVWAVTPRHAIDDNGEEDYDKVEAYDLSWSTSGVLEHGKAKLDSRRCDPDEELLVVPRTKFRVAAHKLHGLRKKIERLNRKAAKCNFPEIYFAEGEVEVEVIYYNTQDEVISFSGDIDLRRVWRIEHREWVTVTVVGDAPHFNDWSCIGILEHLTQKDVLVYSIADNDVPEKYRTSGNFCEHCNKKRARKKTMIIRHDDGTTKQIGLQCAKDFVGDASAAALVGSAEMWANIFGDLNSYDEEWDGEVGPPTMIPIIDYLCFVSKCIHENGWISRSKCGQLETPTADAAYQMMFPTKADLCAMKERKEERTWPTADHRAIAEAGLKWAQDLDGNSDFEHNLKVLANMECFPTKKAGFVAYMVQGYLKSIEVARKEEAKKAYGDSEYVGKVGGHIDCELTLEFYRFIPSDYGFDKHLYKFRDAQGNLFVWFASASFGSSSWMEEGVTYEVHGKIRDHNTFRDDKQTILTNCNFPCINEGNAGDLEVESFIQAKKAGLWRLVELRSDKAPLIGLRFEHKDLYRADAPAVTYEVIAQRTTEDGRGTCHVRKVGKRGKCVGKPSVMKAAWVKVDVERKEAVA